MNRNAAPDSPARSAARERLRAQRDHLAVCRWLHLLVPLTVYYGPRPLLAVPLAELPRWRWAA
jgi:hypothetical protein